MWLAYKNKSGKTRHSRMNSVKMISLQEQTLLKNIEYCLCIGSKPPGTFSMETVQTNTSSSQHNQYTDNDCERPRIREIKQNATLVSLERRSGLILF